MSHREPSTNSFAAPPEPGSAALQSQCPCGKGFLKLFPEQLRCPSCRAQQLSRDAQRGDAAEVAMMNHFLDQWTPHNDDVQWIDENGRTIWGFDLAKRYRSETAPRWMTNQFKRWQ